MSLITLLTVNLHKGFGVFNRRFILPELREAVRSVSADLVFLQEVLGEHELHAARVAGWPQAPHYEFLADSLWSDHAYGRNAVYPQGHHGNALLSKFPIRQHANHDVSVAGPERRGLLHSVLALPDGRELHAICVHLGLREAHRQQQLRALCRLVAQLPADCPLVVAGDFNDWRERAHRLLRRHAGLREVFVQSQGRAARSFPARWPLLRLDRIYVRGVAVQRPLLLPRRPWSHLSDHAPLAAEIRL
ncbi:endonuclease/exonuclease/phosphatase family protein [Roseateles sp. DAIF2]|uniref:endonuclease/exonuclease/phosphatase family protein n=1 Tax=Roseateles sp. DAIF2 TaxID=2714952 RepID=UPI0018A309A2|nr:endonuclease/exonuclease/phosphatase family protein [Roseateles sp. DAIF2]QPF72582.1 endonuclease/exonuclease/phosphatase family protein [Roseateles sp. DAIF2]